MRGNRITQNERPPRGMTLIELLVVIVLLTTLVTTAIPVLSPSGDERKLREASRGLNTYLKGAQSRAIETGRPFGVAFRRLSADSDKPADNAVCAQVRYVEVPPAYSGVDSGSMARLCVCETDGVRHLGLQLVHTRDAGVADPQAQNGAGLPPGYRYDLLPNGFFRPGDRIEIGGNRTFSVVMVDNAEGPRPFDAISTYGSASPFAGYYNTANTPGPLARTSIFRVRLLNDDVQFSRTAQPLRLTHNWKGEEIGGPEEIRAENIPAWQDQTYRFTNNFLATAPAPYKVYRQPLPAGGEPLELAAGTAIDLQASVFGDGTRVYRPELDFINSAFQVRTDDFMVLFSPEGSIHRVYGLLNEDANSQFKPVRPSTPVSGSLALLIGRRELIPGQPQTANAYAEPIPIDVDDYNDLPESEATELTDQYNWLNLESQWVVIGGQSGSITTINNTAVYPSLADTDGDGVVALNEQLAAALENAPRRTASGGR